MAITSAFLADKLNLILGTSLFLICLPKPAFLDRAIASLLNFSFIRWLAVIIGSFLVGIFCLTLLNVQPLEEKLKCQTAECLVAKPTILLQKFKEERDLYIYGFAVFSCIMLWRISLFLGEIRREEQKATRVD